MLRARSTVRMIRLLTALAIALATPTVAAASVGDTSESVSWARDIDQARRVLGSEDGDDLKTRVAELEKIRATLASERDAALARARAKPMEVQILERRIAAIGAPPADGGYESPIIAERRTGLERELDRRTQRQRVDEERYLRLVVMIEQVDARIATLRNRLLTTRVTTPANPAAWSAFVRESQAKWRELSRTGVTLGGALLVLALGLVFGIGAPIVLQKKLMVRVNRRIEAKGDLSEATGWLVVRDVLTLAVMLAALGILIIVVGVLGGEAPVMKVYLVILLAMGLNALIAYWLATALFAPRLPAARFVPVTTQGARQLVWLVTALGIASGLEGVYEEIEKASPYTAKAAGTASFLTILSLAGILFFIGRTLLRSRNAGNRAHSESEAGDGEDRIDWLGLFARAMEYAAIAAVGIAVIGYIAIARRVLLPTIATIAIIFILVLTYDRLLRIGRAISSRLPGHEPRSQLFGRAVLMTLLILVGLPSIALVWGLRIAEISDFVVLLRDGIAIGNTTVSLGTIVTLVGVFVAGYIVTRWIQRLLQTMLLPRLEMDKGTQSALVTGVGYVGLLVSMVAAIAAAGIDLSSLTIVLGALSVGIGFGLQGVVANFVSGIILLLERPIKEGDSVEVGGHSGIVDKISVRATRIQAFNHDDVIIPNSELISGIVRNRTFSDPMTRIECKVGIAYDSDVQKAFAALLAVADAHPNVIQDPPPKVVMEALGDSALALKLMVFIDEVGNAVSVQSDLYVEMLKRLQAEGVEIPFPTRTVHWPNPAPGPPDA